MYDNEITFTNDFIRAYPGYNRSDRSARAIGLCYRVYLNSRKSPLGMLVMGRIERYVPETRTAVVGIGDIERTNFGTTAERASGSVLWSTCWSVPLNDSWLLGGVHGRHPFHLASPRTPENILHPTHGCTVTGRELVGLSTFGYQLHPNASLGEVFHCTDPGKAAGATFQAYEAAFQAIKRTNDWLSLAGSPG